MVLKTSALIYGFLLYLNPVKVQCYRIAHVHNYYILNQILRGILFGSARVNLDKLTVIEWGQDIESVSVIGLYVISFESAGLKLSHYKYL